MFERKSSEWRGEQARVRRKLERHESENQAYIAEGLALVEVANKAAEMYPGRTPERKRRRLNFIRLNSTWRGGSPEVERREPINLVAESIAECRANDAASAVTGGARPRWLPEADLVRTADSRLTMIFRRPRSLHSSSSKVEKKKEKVVRETVEERAERYLAMIDGEVIRTRADLARHLGVSRARVTQVLAVRSVRGRGGYTPGPADLPESV